MEIRLDGALVTTTMRTPGHDFELAVGFCHTEGLLSGAPVTGVRYCATGSAAETGYNVVTVDTGGLAPVPEPRVSLTTSSCGLCGTAGLDQLQQRLEPLVDPVTFELDVLAKVPDQVAGLPGPVRGDRRRPRRGCLRHHRHPARHPRGHRAAQRRRQGGRPAPPRRRPAGPVPRVVRQRPSQLRDRPEGLGGAGSAPSSPSARRRLSPLPRPAPPGSRSSASPARVA